jgi:hypothetical protein
MMKKITTAVPSFSRLSPSIRVPMDFGAPSYFKSETTATGSVAEITAPKSKQAAQGSVS